MVADRGGPGGAPPDPASVAEAERRYAERTAAASQSGAGGHRDRGDRTAGQSARLTPFDAPAPNAPHVRFSRRPAYRGRTPAGIVAARAVETPGTPEQGIVVTPDSTSAERHSWCLRLRSRRRNPRTELRHEHDHAQEHAVRRRSAHAGGVVAGPAVAAQAAPAQTEAGQLDDGTTRQAARASAAPTTSTRPSRTSTTAARPRPGSRCRPRARPSGQDELAAKLGTTENGTDSAFDITRVLNEYSGGKYKTTEIRDDVATGAGRAAARGRAGRGGRRPPGGGQHPWAPRWTSTASSTATPATT